MQMYRTFGLVLSSPLPLPELIPAEGVADVVVHFDRINLPSEPLPGRPCVLATATEAWFSYPDIGRFRVADGKEIVVDPYDGVDEVALRQTLLGSVLAMVLHQRGLFVLHGSAVGREDGAVAIVAESGYGKSTTAAALVAEGFTLLSDDIVAVRHEADDQPCVLPGFPEINLWSDVGPMVRDDSRQVLTRVENRTKSSYRLGASHATGAIPLRRVYVLDVDDRAGITPLPRSEGLRILFDHTFGPEIMRFEPPKAVFEACSRLVLSIPVRRLTRTTSLDDLPRFVESILHDLDEERNLTPT